MYKYKIKKNYYFIKSFLIIITLFIAININSISYAFAGSSFGGGLVLGLLAPNPIAGALSDEFSPGDTPTGGTMCAIVGMMNSGIARAIAALAVIALGLGALFGQVKWTQAIMLGVGIAMMLGASSLVGQLPDYNENGTDIQVKGIEADFSDGEVQSCH